MFNLISLILQIIEAGSLNTNKVTLFHINAQSYHTANIRKPFKCVNM